MLRVCVYFTIATAITAAVAATIYYLEPLNIYLRCAELISALVTALFLIAAMERIHTLHFYDESSVWLILIPIALLWAIGWAILPLPLDVHVFVLAVAATAWTVHIPRAPIQ